MFGECGTFWFLFHFILLLFLGGSLYSILRIHLDAQKDGSLSCGKEDDCVLFLFKIADTVTSRKQVSKDFRPKLIQSSLYLRYRCCNKGVWMSHIRNWVWYRQGKAKYTQGSLYRYSPAEADFTVVWQTSVHFQTIVGILGQFTNLA